MIFRIILIATTMLLFTLSVSAQSGWLRSKGSGYGQLSVAYLASDNYYNIDGEQLTTNEYQTYGIMAYAEYGISDKFNVLLNGPLLRRQSFSGTAATYGVGDVRLGGKYALLTGSWPVSFALEAELPLSPKTQFALNDVQETPGIINQINLPASDGELNFWGTLAASHSLSEQSFVSAYGAFNARTQGLSHQVKFGFEAGYQFFNKLYVMGQVTAQRSLGEPQRGLSFVRGEGVGYTSIGATLFYEIDEHLNVVLAGTTYNDLVFSRKNIYSGAALNVGVAYQW
jgi:hypothetical protein